MEVVDDFVFFTDQIWTPFSIWLNLGAHMEFDQICIGDLVQKNIENCNIFEVHNMYNIECFPYWWGHLSLLDRYWIFFSTFWPKINVFPSLDFGQIWSLPLLQDFSKSEGPPPPQNHPTPLVMISEQCLKD